MTFLGQNEMVLFFFPWLSLDIRLLLKGEDAWGFIFCLLSRLPFLDRMGGFLDLFYFPLCLLAYLRRKGNLPPIGFMPLPPIGFRALVRW